MSLTFPNRATLDTSPEGIALLDREGRYTYLNRAHVELFGFERAEDLLGQSWKIFYNAEEIAFFEATAFPVLAAQGSWRGTAWARRRDGTCFYELVTLSALPDGGLLCMCSDISDLLASSQHRQLMFDVSRALLCIADDGGVLLEVNATWTHVLGYSPDELRSRPFLDFVHPEDRADTSVAFERLLEGQPISNFTNRYRHRDGSEVYLDWAASMHKNDRRLVYASAHDVTPAKRAELSLFQSLQREHELSRLKSQFLSLINHELRTPVGTLYLGIDLIEMNLERQRFDAVARSASQLRQALNDLQGTLDELLELQKLRDGTFELTVSRVAVGQLLRSVARRMQAAYPFRGRLTLPRDEGPFIDTDETLLRHVVANLLSNAFKYTPEDGHVTARAEALDDTVAITVVDTGIGIPEDEQPRLFSTFFRSRNAGSRPGIGIGLSIVQHCTDALGGRITFHSALGQGSTFTATIPPVPAAASVPSPAMA